MKCKNQIIIKIAFFVFYFAQCRRSVKMKIAFFLAKSYSYVFLRKTRKQLCLYLTLDHIYTIKNTILII
jgi:hypothetical protein